MIPDNVFPYHRLQGVQNIMFMLKDNSLHQCYAHNQQESFGLRLSLQHISDELYQKLQLEAPGLASSHGRVPSFLQLKDHLNQALQ